MLLAALHEMFSKDAMAIVTKSEAILRIKMNHWFDLHEEDLEPYPSQTAWFKEYFEVEAGELEAFLKAYDETYAVMRGIPGYRGVTIVTTIPPNSTDARRTKYTSQQLGGSTEL